MKYNFEHVNSRYNMGSAKWNEIAETGVEYGDEVIPFSVADMEFDTAPEIKEAIMEVVDHVALGYANPTDEFKQSVCNWLKKRHGWEAKPEWIIGSHGVVDAFFACVKAFTKEGDGVMLMTPVYYPMYKAIANNNRNLVELKLVRKETHYEIDFDDFEKKAADKNTKLLILCSPHNPCSRVWRREELEKIAEICNKNHVLVISDEIHFDLVMPGYKHIVYASISEEAANNCVICTAPSKTFNLAGLQTSSMLIPNPEIRKQYMDYLLTTCSSQRCNILGYAANKAAYDKCEAWLEEALQVIKTNKDLVTEFFAREFPQIKIMDFEATYLLWMDFSGLEIDYKELERINHQEAGLFFDEGYVFGEAGEGFERWNLACPTKYVKAALERMKKVYPKYIKY